MVVVTINDPINWHKQVVWLIEQCPHCKDLTNWGMWQIGQDDIYVSVDKEVAVMFKLRFDYARN